MSFEVIVKFDDIDCEGFISAITGDVMTVIVDISFWDDKAITKLLHYAANKAIGIVNDFPVVLEGVYNYGSNYIELRLQFIQKVGS